MKEFLAKSKDAMYISSLVLLLAGWIATSKIDKAKTEMNEQAQNAKIEALQKENNELQLTIVKQKDYVEENSNNILWIVRILELDSD